ncbi:MAG: hypothetical protein JNK85_22500 [Verrucomicrobiales bacterium]|nr:hypothetical protein [Verrucomicrobiales bacterium]
MKAFSNLFVGMANASSRNVLPAPILAATSTAGTISYSILTVALAAWRIRVTGSIANAFGPSPVTAGPDTSTSTFRFTP